MSSTQEGVMGLYYGWASGESGWKNQMDANLTKIGAMMQISVIDRDLTAAPSTPANGDTYIVAASATGVWAAKDGQIAVWRSPLAAWEFYVPKNGWQAVILDESKMTTRLAGAWTAGISL